MDQIYIYHMINKVFYFLESNQYHDKLLAKISKHCHDEEISITIQCIHPIFVKSTNRITKEHSIGHILHSIRLNKKNKNSPYFHGYNINSTEWNTNLMDEMNEVLNDNNYLEKETYFK